MTRLRVTLESSQNDRGGIIAWIEENELNDGIFLVDLVDEGQALVSRWIWEWWKSKGPKPALLCPCGRTEQQLIYIRERVQIRSLPPQSCLVVAR